MKKEMLFNAAKKYGTPLYVFDLDILKENRQSVFVQDLVRRSTFVMR